MMPSRRYVPRPKPDTGFQCPKGCGNVYYRYVDPESRDRACVICGATVYDHATPHETVEEAKRVYREACRLCGYEHIWGAPCLGGRAEMFGKIRTRMENLAEVAQQMQGDGYARRDIAEQIGVSDRSVDRYMTNGRE